MVENGFCQPPSVAVADCWQVPVDGQVVDIIYFILIQFNLAFQLRFTQSVKR